MSEKQIWEYIHGYASQDDASKITFFDYTDNTLYRDVHISTIGQHGWELVSTLMTSQAGKQRYEYFFKRDRSRGYPAGFSDAKRD